MDDIGLLILRAVLGAIFVGHGTQKLFGWFDGPGVTGTGEFFRGLGLRPARFWALAVGLAEIVGGVLTALGLLGPIGPALLVGVMVGAIALAHMSHGFWNANGGIEFPLVNLTAAVALALTGPGHYALDRTLNVEEAVGGRLHEPEIVAAALLATVVIAVVGIISAGPTIRKPEMRPTG